MTVLLDVRNLETWYGPIVAMQEFITVQQRLSTSADAAEGVRSFVEKRPARFTGK